MAAPKIIDVVQVTEISKITGEVKKYDMAIYDKNTNTKVIEFAKKKFNDEAMADLIKNKCGSFYFYFYNRELDALDIKDSMKLRFLFLCTYANYDINGSYLTYDNGVKIDKKDIKKLLKLSDYEGNNTIKTFLDNQLMTIKNGVYIVNNKYIKRGSLTKKEDKENHTRIFHNGLRELYNNCNQKQHKQLYYIFKLLPYVHFKCNAICKNPTCENVEEVVPFKLSEICELVGLDKSNARRFEKDILKLQLDKKYALVGIICGSGVWYKINPILSYAGTSGCLKDFSNLLADDFSVKVK